MSDVCVVVYMVALGTECTWETLEVSIACTIGECTSCGGGALAAEEANALAANAL